MTRHATSILTLTATREVIRPLEAPASGGLLFFVMSDEACPLTESVRASANGCSPRRPRAGSRFRFANPAVGMPPTVVQ